MLIFHKKLHKKFLLKVLKGGFKEEHDSIRVTLAFFAISGLDILNALDDLSDEFKRIIIKWIYSTQHVSTNFGGFQNSASFKFNDYNGSQLGATYSALCVLLILGDDLSKVDKTAICSSVKNLQLSNGCFMAAKDSEADMRFVFCAAAISYILNDWSGVDTEKAVQFILESISYDSGIAQAPELESHGGSTYCGIAALALMGKLDSLENINLKGMKRWLLNRQHEGFQGRPNKEMDTCYSFWLGATLEILNMYQYTDVSKNMEFLLARQHTLIGGFSKCLESHPDPLHTYFGIAGLGLTKYDGLENLFASLNITKRTHSHLMKIHESWCK